MKDATGQLTGLFSDPTANGALEETRTWQYDNAGNMTAASIKRRGITQQMTRTITGTNQLTATSATPAPTFIEGTVDEPANVKVNNQTATLHYSAAPPYLFQKQLDLPAGENAVTIQATDARGNVSTRNALVTVRGDEALGYDASGNLTLRTWKRPAAGGGAAVEFMQETYTWDAENRLLGWEKKRLAIPGQQTEAVLASATWQYDGLGRRVKEHNVAGGTETDRNFVWDGMEMVQWQNAVGTVQRNLFAQGEQIMAGAGVETLLTVTDHLGSVRGWHRLGDGTRGEAQFSAYAGR